MFGPFITRASIARALRAAVLVGGATAAPAVVGRIAGEEVVIAALAARAAHAAEAASASVTRR